MNGVKEVVDCCAASKQFKFPSSVAEEFVKLINNMWSVEPGQVC
jgi:hypothetical protein